MTARLLAQVAADPTGSLIQYGALGILAAIACISAKVLFGRVSEALDLERKRSERLEAELKAVNDAVREKYMTTLAEATTAIAETLAIARRRD